MLKLSSIIGLYFLLGMFIKCRGEENVGTFTFKEFQYKDTPKNEMTFREYETACEQSRVCSGLKGLIRTHCVRECVSPSCYREIYQADPLEEGEIDIIKIRRKISFALTMFAGITVYKKTLFVLLLQWKIKSRLKIFKE
ncbi:unnamed protein product [Colias eurytheme]|nr:unnamed protein product [Colias eurytheme]